MRAGLLLTRHLTSRNRRAREESEDTAHLNELELYAAVFICGGNGCIFDFTSSSSQSSVHITLSSKKSHPTHRDIDAFEMKRSAPIKF